MAALATVAVAVTGMSDGYVGCCKQQVARGKSAGVPALLAAPGASSLTGQEVAHFPPQPLIRPKPEQCGPPAEAHPNLTPLNTKM